MENKARPSSSSEEQKARFNLCLAESLERLSAQYRVELTTSEIEGWRLALEGLSPDYFSQTVTELIKNEQFMPKPATFRQAYSKMVEGVRNKPADCRRCGGSGWWVRPSKDVAERCKHEEW